MTEFFNRSDERDTRRQLRKKVSGTEARLWWHLKGRQLLGCKFRRQYSVGPFVMDFYAPRSLLESSWTVTVIFRKGREHTMKSGQHSSARSASRS